MLLIILIAALIALLGKFFVDSMTTDITSRRTGYLIVAIIVVLFIFNPGYLGLPNA